MYSLYFQLDLPYSIPFYRWLLAEENSIGLPDLDQVAPEVQVTLLRLNEIVKQRDLIQADLTLDAMEKTEKVHSFGPLPSLLSAQLISSFSTDRSARLGRLPDRRPGPGLCTARSLEH